VSCEQAGRPATARQSRCTAGRAPALQELLHEGATRAELVSDFLLRVVQMMLIEEDDSFAQVIRILPDGKRMTYNRPYNQVKTDLSAGERPHPHIAQTDIFVLQLDPQISCLIFIKI